ncbi:MAG: EMC3/TMCO1 family protein [Candidatus Woesearchaeota archaeon]
MAFSDFLNPIMGPLLKLGPFWAILIISLVVSALITLVYKLVTNQKLMKELKEEQKEYQKKLRSLRDNPAEMMKVQKEAMKKNMAYMKHSFKPTLITMLPIILIFGWMSAHLSFEPIYPGETYSITADFQKGISGEIELFPDEDTQLLSEAKQQINSGVTWQLKSKTEGAHILEFNYDNQSYTKKVLITKELAYEEPITVFQHSDLTVIRTEHSKLRPLGQTFSIFGWQPGWLGIYIILSLIFSLSLRKIFKIY